VGRLFLEIRRGADAVTPADLVAASPEGVLVGCAAVGIAAAYGFVRSAGAMIAADIPLPAVRERLRRTRMADTLFVVPMFAGLALFVVLLATGHGDTGSLETEGAFGITFAHWGFVVIAASLLMLVLSQVYWGLGDPVITDEERRAAREEARR
jgi:hypothetical protein